LLLSAEIGMPVQILHLLSSPFADILKKNSTFYGVVPP
jgi:hypothetical protein